MEPNRLKEELRNVPNPRRQYGNLRYKLDEILKIGLCSVIYCGEDFEDMEHFEKEREDWLRVFLELENGIPGHDTFRRVFERINPIVSPLSIHTSILKNVS